MDENPVAFLDWESFLNEREGCEALQDRCSCDAWLEAGGNKMRFCCRRCSVFGVRRRSEPNYSVADFEVVEVSTANRDNGAFTFATEDFGFLGGVETGSEVAGGCVSLGFGYG